ncbi:MAG TPA: helix-turn-helix domain-containing protein [Acidimicrobiales bacterium]|nr:helix-turn-helix domain-containing protein [Acidimicrobiales bacterium]
MSSSWSEPDIWLDVSRRIAGLGTHPAVDGGAPVRLSPAEVATLAAFAAEPRRALSRAELARRSGLRERSARRPDSVLSDLRRALGCPDLFRNVRGRGWVLAGRVTLIAAAAAVADGAWTISGPM